MTLTVRAAARAILRSKTPAIVTEEAVSAFQSTIEEAAHRLAEEMAAAVQREAAARRNQGLAHLPRMVAKHAKVITIPPPLPRLSSSHRAQEVHEKNGAGIEA